MSKTSKLCIIQECERQIRMISGFSLYTIPLLVALVTYLGSETWRLREWKTTRE